MTMTKCLLRVRAAILVPLLLAVSAGNLLAQDPVADSLIGAWIDAVGGMSTYERFTSASFTVTTTLYDTLTGRVKRSRPRYAHIQKTPRGEATRVERWEGDRFIQQGFDGRGPAWAALAGILLPDTAKDATEALYVARDLFYWLGLPFKLRDPGVYVRYLGLVTRPGAAGEGEHGSPSLAADGRYHGVGVSFGEGVGEHQDTWTYYFAPGHPFPHEVTYVEEGKTNVNRLLWGPTERGGEIRYPSVVRRDWITASGKRTKALVISDVTINDDVPIERFERP
jgi:hypothetical protein